VKRINKKQSHNSRKNESGNPSDFIIEVVVICFHIIPSWKVRITGTELSSRIDKPVMKKILVIPSPNVLSTGANVTQHVTVVKIFLVVRIYDR
jgi:hypothetical protein